MIVLGISCYYHDSAIALMRDGVLLFAIQEERVSRKKHDSSFPVLSINTALEQTGIKFDDIDTIVFYETPQIKFKRILGQILDAWPWSWKEFSQDLCYYLKFKYDMEKVIKENLFFKGKVLYSEHHLSHALAASYYAPYDEYLTFVLDGIGEKDCCTIFQGNTEEVKKLSSIEYPDSMGLYYSAFTQYLGFRINNGEYKVMGLAPYGKLTYIDKLLKHVVFLRDDGTFSLNMKYFDFFSKTQAYTSALTQLLGIPPRELSDKNVSQEHMDLAASVQHILELMMENLVGYWVNETGIKNVCFGGGVALNCTANSHLIRKLGINSYIHPAAGDSGGAFGAAIFGGKGKISQNKGFTPYLGKEFSDIEIEIHCKGNDVEYNKLYDGSPSSQTYRNMAYDIAKNLAEKKVVALYQGRDEWGPRSLGNRSILASPIYEDMKDHLNAKIKFREAFRPFAPTVSEEDYEKYFETLGKESSPYMLYTHQSKCSELPAITHVNNTSRVQTVNAEQNKLFYDIIKEHEKLTGYPVVVNTSFNLKGEPIVFSPSDAIKTFLTSGIDVLYLNNYKITK